MLKNKNLAIGAVILAGFAFWIAAAIVANMVFSDLPQFEKLMTNTIRNSICLGLFAILIKESNAPLIYRHFLILIPMIAIIDSLGLVVVDFAFSNLQEAALEAKSPHDRGPPQAAVLTRMEAITALIRALLEVLISAIPAAIISGLRIRDMQLKQKMNHNEINSGNSFLLKYESHFGESFKNAKLKWIFVITFIVAIGALPNTKNENTKLNAKKVEGTSISNLAFLCSNGSNRVVFMDAPLTLPPPTPIESTYYVFVPRKEPSSEKVTIANSDDRGAIVGDYDVHWRDDELSISGVRSLGGFMSGGRIELLGSMNRISLLLKITMNFYFKDNPDQISQIHVQEYSCQIIDTKSALYDLEKARQKIRSNNKF